MIIPMNDYLIIKSKEENSEGTIITKNIKNYLGVVLFTKDNNYRSGDTILYNPDKIEKIKLNSQELLVIKTTDVYAMLGEKSE